MFFQPLEQFEILVYKCFFDTFFITNSILYLFFTIFSLYFFLYIPKIELFLLPKTCWEYLSEEIFLIIYTMVDQQTNRHYRLGFYFPALLSTHHLHEHVDERLVGSRKQLNEEIRIMIISRFYF